MPLRPLDLRRFLAFFGLCSFAVASAMQNNAGLTYVLTETFYSSELLSTVSAMWHAIRHVLAPAWIGRAC